MQDLNLSNFNKPSPLNRRVSRPGQNKSLQVSNRESLAFLGVGDEVSTDPKGRILRQLRLSQNIDPAALATQACISLAQLYEIEKGLQSLFYSSFLRQQAARRIAQLLGADWDHLLERQRDALMASNVVPLQRHGPSKSAPLTHNALLMNSYANPSQALAIAPSQTSVTQPVAPVLSTPSAELQDPEASDPALCAPGEPLKAKPDGVLRTLAWLMGVCVAGAATGYAFVAWSPYRWMWPSELVRSIHSVFEGVF